MVVVGIDIQDRDEAARTFLAEFGHSFPNAPDPAGRIAVDYGVYGVPETFFIDRRGRVVSPRPPGTVISWLAAR